MTLEKGTRVKATRTWGYGSETVVGVIDRRYLEQYDSNAVLTIWTENTNYLAVTIDARYWDVVEL